MYSVPQSRQLTIFLLSLGAGFLLGIIYDIFRAVRLSLTKSKAAVVCFDIIYFLTSGILTFLFMLAVNKGEVRLYIIAGEIIGWFFYYFSFGLAVIKATDIFVKYTKKVSSAVGKILCAPFHFFFRVFERVEVKIANTFQKNRKNFEKSRKKHLPKARLYVYNLLGIISARRNEPEKGGRKFVKHKKEEKKNSTR